MAFEFFRRRQKMVMIIMAILMVAFLLPVGLSNYAGMANKIRTLGAAGGEKLTTEDVQKADSDMKLIAILQALRMPKMDDFMAMENLAQRESVNPAEVYALLLQEAQRSGMIARDADVDDMLKAAGGADAKDQDAVKQYVFARLKEQKIKPELFYAAMRNWLLIDKYFNASAPSAPPSDPELRQIYRDFNEKLKVRVAIVPADKFAKDVAQPTDEEVDKQFDRLRMVKAGEFSKISQSGFGYAQPDRVQVQYVVVNQLPIERVTTPTDDSVRDYYRHNTAQFVTKPEADDKGNPITGTGKQMDFAQAKPEIIAKLSDELAGDKIDEILSQLQQSLPAATSQPAGANPYAAIVNKMIDTSPPVLDRKIDVDIQSQPLDKAIEAVAQAAGLKAIVYPYGGTGKTALSASLQVTLVKSQARLEDVLAAVTAQVKWQPIKWATLLGFDGDLFPLSVGADASGAGGDTSFFPLVAGDSGPVSFEQMRSDPLLGHCYTSPSGQPAPLMFLAFPNEARARGVAVNPMKVPSQGPRMYVITAGPAGRGELDGRLLWTLANAVPAYEPEHMDDQIRRQVIRDLKQAAAFDKAMDYAKTLKAMVQHGQDLATLAKAAGLEVQDSGFVARMEAHYGEQPTPGIIPGFEARDVLARQAPGANYDALAQQVIRESFAMVPKPGEQATTSPATGPATLAAERSTTSPAGASQPSTMPGESGVVIIPMRWANQVAVVQRLDYRPAVLGKYLEPGSGLSLFPFEIDRASLAKNMNGSERRISRDIWFQFSAVKARTGYNPVAPEK